MAYDAAMLRATLAEISRLTGGGAKVEKIYQPASDEVTLTLRMGREIRKLLLNAGTSAPRVALSDAVRENPPSAPMFCMLLRKHLAGARLVSCEQLGYERCARFTFAGYDEMGYAATRHLVAEVMGKYSNLMLLDGADRIIAVLRPVDFTTSRVRQVLPGMTYELPPPQDKRPPLDESRESFLSRFAAYPPERTVEKFIVSTYLGTASQVAREIAYRATGSDTALCAETDSARLWEIFSEWFGALREGRVTPTLVLDADGVPRDFAYAEMRYRTDCRCEACPSFAALLDRFFAERDRLERIRQRASDLVRLLANATSRIERKLEAQTEELADCERGEEWRRSGELLLASLYMIKRGDAVALVPDYNLDPPETVRIALDPRRAPAENAEHYFKLYRKARVAREVLSEQIAKSRRELAYLESVSSFLDRAETEQDLLDLRDELYHAGYASRMKSYSPAKTKKMSKPIETVTPGGYRLLIGRNNLQNDHLTFRVAEKGDLWFHAKDVPGSHVLLLCGGEEPSAEDYTYAASLAAGYSQASGSAGVAVDYTRVKNIRKPAGARPGYVIYKTNYSAYVTPTKLS